MSTLKFEDNTPVSATLKYASGKHVTGKFGEQVMYSLKSGEVMYIPLIVEKKLQELNAKAGQQFSITKAKSDGKTTWNVEPITTKKPPQAAAALLNGTSDLDGHDETPRARLTVLADALCTAVEAAHAAEQHSLKIGRPTTFDPRNITSMALTLVIQRREHAA